MDNVIDLLMVRHLIEQFGLSVGEAVRIDITISREYGLLPASSLSACSAARKTRTKSLGCTPVRRVEA